VSESESKASHAAAQLKHALEERALLVAKHEAALAESRTACAAVQEQLEMKKHELETMAQSLGVSQEHAKVLQQAVENKQKELEETLLRATAAEEREAVSASKVRPVPRARTRRRRRPGRQSPTPPSLGCRQQCRFFALPSPHSFPSIPN
jgi:hypothetical protein